MYDYHELNPTQIRKCKLYNLSPASLNKIHRPVPWAGISQVRARGNSSPITVPAKILPCERLQTRRDICGDNLLRNLRGRSMPAVQSITSILLYILVPVPVKYPPWNCGNCTHEGGEECPPSPWNTRPWNWGVMSFTLLRQPIRGQYFFISLTSLGPCCFGKLAQFCYPDAGPGTGQPSAHQALV